MVEESKQPFKNKIKTENSQDLKAQLQTVAKAPEGEI